MAEGKRPSVAGRVATPRTGASSPATLSPTTPMDIAELSKAVGARLKLNTAAPHAQTFEGTLFTACALTQLVAINTRNGSSNHTSGLGGQPGDYHIIPVARIQSFQIISPAGNVEMVPLAVPDYKRLAQRESDRIKKLKDEEQSRGQGVSVEGQAIFDSFRRINTPIRWHNQEMIVHDAVIISPPYTVDDCRGAKDKQETLNRVRKVLEGERRKIKEREERDKRNAASEGIRKGG